MALIVTIAVAAARASPEVTPFSWISVGPSFISPSGEGFDQTASSGRVSSLAVMSDGIIAATANGGVWRYNKASRRWAALTDGLDDLAFGAIAVAPSNEKFIYASTGEMHGSLDSAPGDDIYRSADGGRSWAKVASIPALMHAAFQRTSAIAVDPYNPKIVWVAGSLGVFRSDNGGKKWTPISTDAPVTDLKLDADDPQVAYFTDTKYIWRYNLARTPAMDHDISPPEPTSDALDQAGVAYGIVLAIAPSQHDTIYASYAFVGNHQYGCSAGLFRSTDRGAHWKKVALAVDGDYFAAAFEYGQGTNCIGWYANSVAVDPLDPAHVVAGGVGLADIRIPTPDSPIEVNLSTRAHVHPDHHALVFSADGTLYDAQDGGVWQFPSSSLASGATEAGINLSDGLEVTQFSPGGSWLSGDSYLAGSQDNGIEVASPGTPDTSWTRVETGDGGYTAFEAPDTLYYETQQGAMERRDGSGAQSTVTYIVPPYLTPGLVSWVVPFRIDMQHTGVLYAGGYGEILKTTSGGLPVVVSPDGKSSHGTWAQITGSTGVGLHAITALDVCGDGAEIVAGDDDGTVAYTFDGGKQWFTVAEFAQGRSTSIRAVAIDPSDSETLVVAYSDATSPFAPYLDRITHTKHTAVHREISRGLPAPVNALRFGRNRIFAGTDRGVYVLLSASGSWVRAGTGARRVPAVPVVDLVEQPGTVPGTGPMLALTHGRGAWRSTRQALLSVPKVEPGSAACSKAAQGTTKDHGSRFTR